MIDDNTFSGNNKNIFDVKLSSLIRCNINVYVRHNYTVFTVLL